ncbi:hypothetical protein [Mucilaginibacter ginkgonis]|uniref:DUF1440 domain-containing protein n=1 Tax=Mucilaginibacter ginkgonis TaxID=2682091 RepID=A0A6I4I1K2_9SPHI|nr:hypothetical protein [Mucilaginibacter ginkgonis]QQL50631.1 hypothetical protein GO620_004010 [Mucilaginibacter ginkgonis]
MRRLNYYRSLFIAFIIAGTLDMLSAILLNVKIKAGTSFWLSFHETLVRICRYIASGIYGKAAFFAGNHMIWFGLLFHYLIAYVWVATWFILFPTFKKILKNTVLTGFVFGLFTWLIMNFIIVPMSNTPKPKGGMTAYGILTGLGALVICIGIPVAIIANKYYFGSEKKVY